MPEERLKISLFCYIFLLTNGRRCAKIIAALTAGKRRVPEPRPIWHFFVNV